MKFILSFVVSSTLVNIAHADYLSLVRVLQINKSDLKTTYDFMLPQDPTNPVKVYCPCFVVQCQKTVAGGILQYFHFFVSSTKVGVAGPSGTDVYSSLPNVSQEFIDMQAGLVYQGLSEESKFAYMIVTGAMVDCINCGIGCGANSYEQSYEAGAFNACMSMDVVFNYLSSVNVSSGGGGASFDYDALKQAIQEALQGMSSYYAPPTELELPIRSAPELYPTWNYDVSSFSLSSPSFTAIGTESLDGIISIPVFGQSYDFGWSSYLTGWASELDPYRVVFRYMLLAIVTMSALFLVWKTLRQY